MKLLQALILWPVATLLMVSAEVNAVTDVSGREVSSSAPDGSELELPVSWRLTRAKFDNLGNASETESYMENWALELEPEGGLFLRSRRARVPVVVAKKGPNGPLARMTLDKADLALLVGLIKDRSTLVSGSNESAVTFELGSGLQRQMQLKIDALQDEHLSLWLKVGAPQP